MNFESAARIADALLYEGYLLYPYRTSSVKNQQRWTFGCLLPPEFPQPAGSAERSYLQTECMVLGDAKTQLVANARFLHLRRHEAIAREVDAPTVDLDQLIRQAQFHPFAFAEDYGSRALQGILTLSAQRCEGGAFKLCVQLRNETPLLDGGPRTRNEALAWSLLSSHLLLGVHEGKFVSQLDPPEPLRGVAASCKQVGVWPVLVGDEAGRDMMLAGPIILDDFPQIALASTGDFFDGTEIDEMLTLRIRTLTGEEKREMAHSDPKAEQLLLRCEDLPNDQFLALHGIWRDDERKPSDARVGGIDLEPGMRVRLRPQGRADAFDLALTGMTAVIVSIEQDFEDQLYACVVVDDDPGRDLGQEGKPGHRFFFRPEEVEPLLENTEKLSSGILIAGIGNIFFGDDAFGVEVVRRLASMVMPTGIVVKDFGIRGFDLACALQEGYHTAILVDAVQRGGQPGTLYVLELDAQADESPGELEMHRLEPMQVFRLVQQMGGQLPRLFVVGCEPAVFEPPDDGTSTLSEPVQWAVAKAVERIETLARELQSKKEGPSNG